MQNETINPIRHSALGTVGGTAAGAAGGAVKTGAKTFLYTAIGTALVFGATAAVIAFTGGLGAAAIGTAGTLSNAVANFVGFGLLGGAVGVPLGLFTGTIGGGIGAVTGGSRAASRIRDEKGAANVLDAQLSAYQTQALAAQQATTIYAPSAANHNYAGASTKNQAPLSIQGGTGQDLGTINGMQLQRA